MRIKRIGLICAYACLLGIAILSTQGCKRKRDIFAEPYVKSLGTPSNDAFGLVFTTSVEGYIEPCGCTSDPLGGIARFATIVNDWNVVLKKNLALVDAGNLLFETPTRIEADRCQDEKRIDVLLSTLSSLGLKTTVIGALDNARGTDLRDRTYKAHGLRAMPSFFDKDAKDVVEVIKTPFGNVGVIAIAHDGEVPSDSIEWAKRLAPIKKQAAIKALVVLSQLSIERTKALFHDRAEVDIVVQGQTSSLKPLTPARLGQKGPWLLEGGRQGQFFSMIVLQNLGQRGDAPLPLDPRYAERTNRESLLIGRLDALKKQVENTVVKERKDFLLGMIERSNKELDALRTTPAPTTMSGPHFIFHQFAITKSVASEPAARDRVAAYDKSIPELVKKCEANLECPKALPNEATFVGAQVCKSCHQAAFDVWTNSVYTSVGKDEDGKEFHRRVGHSKAWQTLVDAKKDADRSCVGCHSIGFMEKGGYCRALEVDFRKDVQCEACHGAGSLHAQSGDKQFIKRKVEEATCRGCHQVPHIQSFESFNYDEKVVKILGKGHGENLLKELTHRAKN